MHLDFTLFTTALILEHSKDLCRLPLMSKLQTTQNQITFGKKENVGCLLCFFLAYCQGLIDSTVL